MLLLLAEYYSTFIPGLSQPVKAALAGALPDSKIKLCLDGLVEFESHTRATNIRDLPFVTNSFAIIKGFRLQSTTSTSIDDLARKLLEDRTWKIRFPLPYSPRNSFRIITSVANRLVQIDDSVMEMLEQRIAGYTKLRINRAKPDFEFWLSQRTEGFGFFALRLSYHKAYDKSLQKGELRPELANILCRLSDPLPNELFLDPFCGSGAIPIQRAKFFPKGLVIASDIDDQKIKLLKLRVKELDLTKRMVVRRDDALNLRRYEEDSIHKIVTDPPWGHFSKVSTPIGEFYSRMLREFARILRPAGCAVIVTGESNALENALECVSSKLEPQQRFNILLSGKKACVYVLTRKSDGEMAGSKRDNGNSL